MWLAIEMSGGSTLIRDFALERQVMGEKDGAHATFADHPLDSVLAFDEPLQPLHPNLQWRCWHHRAATSESAPHA